MKESSLGDKVRIEHILQAISEIKNYVRGIDFEEFSINSMILNACLRQLEVVGEASNRITKELRDKYNHIAWREIIALRNIIAHQYFSIEKETIWEIIQFDLPKFERDIQEILSELQSE
ncbi:HepT-like ribonuclease domain-containing protein [Raineya sp.]|jgi:uncharacterized protein with HEPN domain